ncbi:GMC family oxidoreductase [Halobacteriales archaeon QH_1_68_42]|nr:MAG: GMC family oxidoreductase [Halobacteriales archaeon QH_1_68_42]
MSGAEQSSGGGRVHRMPSERADVCVVGAGPAGAIAAARLVANGHEVVVLDAGARIPPDERLRRMEHAQRPAHDWTDVWNMDAERDAYDSTGDVEYPLNHTRVKGIGGTTLHWIGYTPRLHPKDFEMGSRYGLASDWPLSYADLRPYYAAAESAMGVAGSEDNPFAPPRKEPFPMERFPPSHAETILGEAAEAVGVDVHSVPQARNSEVYDGRSKCVGYGTCHPVCPSGAKYDASVHVRKAENHGARVIDRAPVQRFEHGPDGERVEAAVYATPDGAEHRQEARQFVLAGGAIETPRLLLLSRSEQYPDGLANSSGAVGRYLMDHLLYIVTGQVMEQTGQHQVGFSTTVTHQFYDHDEPTPGSFFIGFLNYAGPSPVEVALEDGRWGDDLPDVLAQAYGGHVGTEALVEQLPDPESRVTLSDTETDDHGNPAPEVHWTVGDHGVETGREATALQREILNEAGARVDYSTPAARPLAGSHPMGTTRMGTDPEESVVDPRLRTHDLDNLTVASSSVFRTGGAMNPTLTIAALTLKAVEHVDADL